jgi:hypothetical protein
MVPVYIEFGVNWYLRKRPRALWDLLRKRNNPGQVRAIRAGGLPRTPTMSAYVVMPGRHEAVHGVA